MNQKGFSAVFITLMGLVLICIVGVAYYLGIQKSILITSRTPQINSLPVNTLNKIQGNDATSASNSNQISNWKTYTDTSVGFSFKFPLDCESPKQSSNDIVLECFADKNIDRSLGFVVTPNDLLITINYEKNSDNESLDEYVKRMKESYPAMENLRDLSIGGEPAKAWRSGAEQYVRNDFYHVIYNEKRFDITKQPVNTTKEKVFDQILATFKFTK